MFSINQDHATTLFEAIHTLKIEEKTFYNNWIYEPVIRKEEPSICEQFIPYAIKNELPLKELANIILKWSITIPDDRIIEESHFLQSGEHVKLLERIENLLGATLPANLVRNFLFFQTATEKIFTSLQSFESIQKTIISEYLEHPGIPENLFTAWSIEGSNFEKTIETTGMPLLYGFYRLRFISDLTKIVNFLQLTTYPIPHCSFQNLMPSDISNQFLFNADFCSHQNHLKLVHQDFITGPATCCHWFFDSNMKKPYFFVSIVNSLQKPRKACSFYIPLNISLSKPWVSTFCRVLQTFVDFFAINLENQMVQQGDCPDCTPSIKNENFSKMFDTYLNNSPLLGACWTSNEKTFLDDVDSVKTELYLFIQSLRSNFKKSFFHALGHLTESEIAIKSQNSHIFTFDESRDNHFFSQFFDDAYEEIQKLFSSGEIETQISIENFVLKIKKTKNLIEVTMKLGLQKNTKKLKIIYDAFSTKHNFIRFLKWQAELYLFRP
ncbi:MAG: hypothetical protein LW832_01710 [Parachlamydia sp.]|jgi:hypothetical protein|nr:hypothetical protein [Parachlamydia sp.]